MDTIENLMSTFFRFHNQKLTPKWIMVIFVQKMKLVIWKIRFSQPACLLLPVLKQVLLVHVLESVGILCILRVAYDDMCN